MRQKHVDPHENGQRMYSFPASGAQGPFFCKLVQHIHALNDDLGRAPSVPWRPGQGNPRQVNGAKVVAPRDLETVILFTNEYAHSLTCAENKHRFSEGAKTRVKALDVLVQVLKLKIDLLGCVLGLLVGRVGGLA